MSASDLLANRANLNIALYLRSASENKEEGPLLAEAIDDWESSSVTLRAAMDDLFLRRPENHLIPWYNINDLLYVTG